MTVSNSISQLWKVITKEKIGFGQALNKVSLTTAADGVCKAEMTINPEHTNVAGNLHGGLTSTLVDAISGLALSTLTKNGSSGVSVDLHVSFLRGVSLGQKIVIEARTLKYGKNLAYLDVIITNSETGALVAKGSHTKFIGS